MEPASETQRERGALADVLKQLREGAGLSQRGLAEVADVSQATIRDIETGKQRRPRFDTLRLLAEGLSLGQRESGNESLTEAAYRALVEAAGSPEGGAERADTRSAAQRAYFVFDICSAGRTQADRTGRGNIWNDWLLSDDWHLATTLERIQQGVRGLGDAERAMILAILDAVADRVMPVDPSPKRPPSAGSYGQWRFMHSLKRSDDSGEGTREADATNPTSVVEEGQHRAE